MRSSTRRPASKMEVTSNDRDTKEVEQDVGQQEAAYLDCPVSVRIWKDVHHNHQADEDGQERREAVGGPPRLHGVPFPANVSPHGYVVREARIEDDDYQESEREEKEMKVFYKGKAPFVMTGEFRPPKKGEFYLSGAIPSVWDALIDMSKDMGFYIMRRIRKSDAPCTHCGK